MNKEMHENQEKKEFQRHWLTVEEDGMTGWIMPPVSRYPHFNF